MTIGEACIHLELNLELEPGISVSEEQISIAVRFGVELEPDSPDVKKYIIAVLQSLLHQGEKLKISVLDEYIQSAIRTQWKEVLSILQTKGRKLLNVQSGSLFFTLFSPTSDSIEELQGVIWRDKLIEELATLFTIIGKYCRIYALLCPFTIFIARTLCVSVHTSTEGTPFPGPGRGVPITLSPLPGKVYPPPGKGVLPPTPCLGRGYPLPLPGKGYPPPGRGVPSPAPAREGDTPQVRP